MNLLQTKLGFFIAATSLFLVHCSDNGSTSDASGGSNAKGGASSGGASSGGSANGGSANGGSTTGGSSSGGAANGGSSNGSGGASSGGSANGGGANGGGSQGGANTGGKASGGNSATGGGNAGGASGGAGTAGAAGSAGKGGGASAGAGGVSGGAGGGSGSGFTLTSSKLAPGGKFPTDNTCGGMDKSPPFTWSNPPSGTMSYALVLVDMTKSLNHWAVWDIPATTTSLTEALAAGATLTTPVGAKQIAGFNNSAKYVGPCPPDGTHTYVFTLYAIDVATLPNLTTSSSIANVITAIQAHDLASATLSGTSDGK
jgi:Raf kinase inhibitor-like YbhB/YbcL family protein